MNLTKKSLQELLTNIILTAVGSLIGALGIDIFLIPQKIAPGGISGIATIIYHLFGVSTGVLIMVFNIPLIILSFFFLGKRFTFNSLLGTVFLSVFIDAFIYIKPITDDFMLNAIFGGVFVGVGLGIVFRVGSSTGGIDIMSLLVQRFYGHVSVGKIIFIIDIIVITVNALVFQDFAILLYSIIYLVVTSQMLDVVSGGVNYAKTAFIISSKSKEITESIVKNLGRGVTAINATGGYSNQQFNLLMCVIINFEIARLNKIVKEIDDKAFMILFPTREVLGEGFKILR